METSSFHPKANHFSVEIESLRGIAALSVIIGHLYVFTPRLFLQTSSPILSTLIAGFFNPQPAVLLFFTISGLVLGRQLGKSPVNSIPAFMAYLCRRAFRLLQLMWIAVLFAFILNYFQGADTSLSTLYANLTLDDNTLDAPLWSLKVELYCSFFFPLLFFAFANGGKFGNALLFIVLCVLSYFWQKPIFIQFFVFFHAGLLIDKININCKKKYRLVNPLSFVFFGLVYMLAPEFSLGPRNWGYGYWQSWVLPEILACPFILFFIIHNNSLFNRFLRLSFVNYLGKISFSIYLFHFPLLFFMLAKMPIANSLQYMGFAVSYLGLVFVISTIAYHWIELPSNRFGKLLSSILLERNKGIANAGKVALEAA